MDVHDPSRISFLSVNRDDQDLNSIRSYQVWNLWVQVYEAEHVTYGFIS